MKNVTCVLAIVFTGLTGSVQASLSYSGSLSGSITDNSLIVGGGIWNGRDDVSSLSWAVTQAPSGLWHYEYTVTVPEGDIACVIIETSPTFGASNMSLVTSDPGGWVAGWSVDTHDVAGNFGMPAETYGIRFQSTIVDPTTLVIRFDSDRDPVWGDFYARGCVDSVVGDGGRPGERYGYLYNAGFEAADPLAPPDNYPELHQYHVLVPDSNPIPAPGAIVLCALGVVLVGRLRQRGLL